MGRHITNQEEDNFAGPRDPVARAIFERRAVGLLADLLDGLFVEEVRLWLNEYAAPSKTKRNLKIPRTRADRPRDREYELSGPYKIHTL
jgi:hypothetical protein